VAVGNTKADVGLTTAVTLHSDAAVLCAVSDLLWTEWRGEHLLQEERTDQRFQLENK